MTLDLRLQALMRRRGIKSQSQLARLAGVSQSSIHRILLATPGYTPTRGILMRLAHALDTSISWLSEGAATLHWPERGRADGRSSGHAGAGVEVEVEVGVGNAAGAGAADVSTGVADGHGAPFDLQREWRELFMQLPRAEREALLVLARLMQQRCHAVESTTHAVRFAIAPSLASSAPAARPLALESYEAYQIE